MQFLARVEGFSFAVLAIVCCLSSVCFADEKEQVETSERLVVQMERLCKAASEYTNALEEVKDAATADRSLEQLAKASDAFANEFDAIGPVFDAAKKLADAGRPKSSEYKSRFDAASQKCKTLEQEYQSQNARYARELLRVDNLEGLSSHFWDVFLTKAARLTVAASRLLVLLDKSPPTEQTQYFVAKLALYEEHHPAKVVDVMLSGSKAERALVEKSIRDVLGGSASVLTNGTDDAGLVTVGPVERLDGVAAAIKVGEIIKQDATRRRITVRLPTASNLQREYARLAQLLSSDDTLGKRKAASTLLRVRPSDVANPDTRKLIARGYRNLALEGQGLQRDEAIRGLVIWGGKYSVPILIDLLDKDKLGHSESLYEALAQLKDPKGAEAVARHLGDFFSHRNAENALRKMDSVAEDALIKTAPSNNPDASLAAVQLLGEVGSEKSAAVLQQAANSSNPQVKMAARESLKRIRDRKKTGESVDKPNVTTDPDSPFAEGSGPPVDVAAGTAGKAAQSDPSPPIIVSRQTTFITEPLRSNGLPDYEQYALKLYRDDVTPEKNAAVLLWQAMWPGELEPASYERFCQEIGLALIPSSQTSLTPLYGKANKERITNWLVAQGKQVDKLDIKQWINPAIDHTWTSQEFPPLAEWLDANSRPIDMILEASHRPSYYSPSPTLLDEKYDLFFDMLLPGAQSLREAARILAIRAMRHAGEGRLDEAWQDLLGVHRLSRFAAQGKTIVEQMVAIGINRQACAATAALLSKDAMSVETARKVQRDLTALTEFSSIADSLDTLERVMHLDSVLALKAGNKRAWQERFGNFSDRAIKGLTYRSADWNLALVRGNEIYDRMVAAARMPVGPARKMAQAQIETSIKQCEQDATRRIPLLPSLNQRERGEFFAALTIALYVPTLDKVLEPQDQANTLLHLTRLSAALAVYRAEHGAYPDTLARLVPDVLKELPVDLYNAKPFVYKRTSDGYLLYSAGENGNDDGGSNEQLGIVEGLAQNEGGEPHTQIQLENKLKGTDDICVRVPRPPLPLPKP